MHAYIYVLSIYLADWNETANIGIAIATCMYSSVALFRTGIAKQSRTFNASRTLLSFSLYSLYNIDPNYASYYDKTQKIYNNF